MIAAELAPAGVAGLATLVAAVIDARQKRIPNFVTFPAMVLSGVAVLAVSPASLPGHLLTAVVTAVLGASGVMGMGDVKLFMVISIATGAFHTALTAGGAAVLLLVCEFVMYPASTSAYMLTGVRALVTFDLGGADKEGAKVPFAPYVAAAFFACEIAFFLARG
jgi:prepilin signal peptidase PulO-like enzyme (type II secretory pathway)